MSRRSEPHATARPALPSLARAALVVTLGLSTFACTPKTTFNRGVDVSYKPASGAKGGDRLLGSALELKTEADEQRLKQGGAIYLGALEVNGRRDRHPLGGGGAGGLSGRVSVEAASRGATHFRLVAATFEHANGSAGFQGTSVDRTRAKYALYRVPRREWSHLPADVRPEPTAAR